MALTDEIMLRGAGGMDGSLSVIDRDVYTLIEQLERKGYRIDDDKSYMTTEIWVSGPKEERRFPLSLRMTDLRTVAYTLCGDDLHIHLRNGSAGDGSVPFGWISASIMVGPADSQATPAEAVRIAELSQIVQDFYS